MATQSRRQEQEVLTVPQWINRIRVGLEGLSTQLGYTDVNHTVVETQQSQTQNPTPAPTQTAAGSMPAATKPPTKKVYTAAQKKAMAANAQKMIAANKKRVAARKRAEAKARREEALTA